MTCVVVKRSGVLVCVDAEEVDLDLGGSVN